MTKQFTLNRKGTFRTKLNVSNQCKAPGHVKYLYKIKAVCGPKLDKNGFIIDHIQVDRHVQAAAKHIDSCERLCEHIALSLRLLFRSHGAKLKQLQVRIKPYGKNIVAFMKYEETY